MAPTQAQVTQKNKKETQEAQETQEWLEALNNVLHFSGEQRATALLSQLNQYLSSEGVVVPAQITTPYRNTIPASMDKRIPGDEQIERRIRALIRWNALIMVVRANNRDGSLGGHIATFSSIAALYEVGFNYFFRGNDGDTLGDLIYFQGHSSPGIYARSYLEGRLTEEMLDNFRCEVDGKGLSSYPHPWLMPHYWQFPTVSMGLGPIQAIYQANIMKYQQNRELADHADRKVWCFLGDGECDEPESLGAISLAGREKLDNLIFVVNCNLQRLDGPVRGNGKIIQELEGNFRGAGWNVIKVIWGHLWDPLLAKDKKGLLQKRMDEVVDGEYQNYKFNGGAYTREHFFGANPELLSIVADMSDKEIMYLNRGGHDVGKVYTAYAAAVSHRDQPTVILAKTVKGYGMGAAGESGNEAHSIKKLKLDDLKKFRDRFNIPVVDDQLADLPYYRPQPDSPEMKYLQAKRESLGGFVPARRDDYDSLPVPPLSDFNKQLESTGEREISTTMAFVQFLSTLVRSKAIGQRVVPIVPDEARTFGMEGMFRRLGIYSSKGQLYKPVDAGKIMYYREDKKGQILEEGLNESGSMSGWIAAATSYSNHHYVMVPFYIFYSMFGFQRVGDLAWAAGDSQARGFLIGATAGRTTLNGEGLQHQDGHSHLMAATIPNCLSYDPTYSYELAVIIHDGLLRMYQNKENIFYYITTMNENYTHPKMPEGVEEGIRRGMYLLQQGEGDEPRVQLMGCGTILLEILAAVTILREKYQVVADVWSLTGINQLRRDGLAAARWNMLHPQEDNKVPYITHLLQDQKGPVIAATDYMKSYADQLRAFIPKPYTVLGTDGYGRSDTRVKLRHFFEVDRAFIVVAALTALADEGTVPRDKIAQAITELDIDVNKLDPATH